MGEHLPCKQGVKGSNPFISIHHQRGGTHLENRIYEASSFRNRTFYKGKGKEENAQTKDRDNRGVILLRGLHGRCRTKGEGNVKECFKKGLMSGKEILSCSAQGGRKRTAGIR